jgi:threonine dehydratase
MPLFSLDDLARATAVVRTVVPPTPAYAWPLLRKRTKVDVVVKHENHTPTGALRREAALSISTPCVVRADCRRGW